MSWLQAFMGGLEIDHSIGFLEYNGTQTLI